MHDKQRHRIVPSALQERAVASVVEMWGDCDLIITEGSATTFQMVNALHHSKTTIMLEPTEIRLIVAETDASRLQEDVAAS